MIRPLRVALLHQTYAATECSVTPYTMS